MPDLEESPSPRASDVLNDELAAIFPPSEAYIAACEMYRCDLKSLTMHLLHKTLNMPSFDRKGKPRINALWEPGYVLKTGELGPRGHHSVMCISKMPGHNKASTDLLRDVATQLNYPEMGDWYMTYTCRYIPPMGGKTIGKPHLDDSMYLLMQELSIINPDYIVLLGADAVKCVCGNKASLEKMRSHVFMLHGPRGVGETPTSICSLKQDSPAGIKIFPTINPGAVLREHGLMDGFVTDIAKFRNLQRGTENLVEECNYRYIDNAADLGKLVDMVMKGPFPELAVDCEWGGDPFGGQLRTIQFSWAPYNACVVILRHQGGIEAQSAGDRVVMMGHLRRLFASHKLIGHNFRADARWLEYIGLPAIENLSFDTMLADHILNENAEHGLESCATRFTTMGRYDWPVAQWLTANGYNKKKIAERGYLDIPDDMLHLYGAQDVDCNIRIKKPLYEMLHAPGNEDVCRCFYSVVMPCNLPLHEIEMTGLLADKPRLMALADQYLAKKQELEIAIQQKLNRPFNPRSNPQKQKLLFEELKLTPYKTTGKPSRMWDDIKHLPPEQLERYSPAVDGETLEALSGSDPTGVVDLLRDHSLIDQITKNFLAPPKFENDDPVYVKGLMYCIAPDGRIHTSMSQTSETGRQKSSAPNLQNLPKRQDKHYERILGNDVHKIRSCMTVPEGYVIIEADYQSAEIYSMGHLSNCKKLVTDANSDLHARGAVTDFGAPKWNGFDEGKKPPEEWKKEFKALRIASKTVRFGVPYQRGAKAIAREIIKETKGAIMCTDTMAQEMIDMFYFTYPEVREYVDMCKECVLNPGFISNPYGRRRRFFGLGDDRSLIASSQREAVNMPIQGTVADTLNVALWNLHQWRKLYPNVAEYRIMLAVHDAIMVQCRGEYAEIVINEILPSCMTDCAVVPSWKPTEFWVPTQEFSLGIDVEVGLRWGEEATAEELQKAGCSKNVIERYAKEVAIGH